MIDYKQASIDDAGLLVDIYNASFFSDYQRFGTCPGYGKTIEMMEESIRLYPKHIILCDKKPVGCVSCRPSGPQEYEIGCLCVIPEYQGKGIGTQAIKFVQTIMMTETFDLGNAHAQAGKCQILYGEMRLSDRRYRNGRQYRTCKILVGEIIIQVSGAA